MTWEYMDKLDYRYEIASRYITKEDRVVELNSGNSRFRNYVEHHTCNDLNNPNADFQITDEEFKWKIEKCDVLVCFGIGGYEIDHNPKESSTITDTIIYLTGRFRPRLLIIESVRRYETILERIKKETNYKLKSMHLNASENWLEDRTLHICKTPYTEDIKS
jgi:hypothetical protein